MIRVLEMLDGFAIWAARAAGALFGLWLAAMVLSWLGMWPCA